MVYRRRESNVVSIGDLRAATQVLLDHLEARHGPEIELSQDYFWCVPIDERYDFSTQPTKLAVGQLSESAEFLEKMIAEPEYTLNYGLVWLGEIFESLGLNCEE